MLLLPYQFLPHLMKKQFCNLPYLYCESSLHKDILTLIFNIHFMLNKDLIITNYKTDIKFVDGTVQTTE